MASRHYKASAPTKTSRERYSDYVEGYAQKVEELLAQNKMPWQRPWEPGEQGPGGGMPYNATTGKCYTGSNAMYLLMTQQDKGYTDDRWLTFNQAHALGAHVRKGEKGTQLVKWVESQGKKDEEQTKGEGEGKDEDEKRLIPVLFTVFNAGQVDGLAAAPVRELKPEHERHEQCERLMKESGVLINYDGGNKAYYRPSTDSIHLPQRDQFHTADGFYATALHELGHATGHPSRLGRDLTGAFGSESYAREELRAEIASFMMGQRLGIGHDPGQHGAYLKSWLKIVREDPKAILHACRDAEKICEHLGVHKYEREATQKNENAQENERASRYERKAKAEQVQEEQAKPKPQAKRSNKRERVMEEGMGMAL